jgi:hypothetical protein
VDEFGIDRVPASDELQVYTWKNASLKELSTLVGAVHSSATGPFVRFSFKLVYQDSIRSVFR